MAKKARSNNEKKTAQLNAELEQSSIQAALEKAGLVENTTSGVAVVKTGGAVKAHDPETEAYMDLFLEDIAKEIQSVVDEAEVELETHVKMVEIQSQWFELERRLNDAKSAWNQKVAVLRTSIEGLRNAAQKTNVWLTYSNADKQTALLAKLSSNETFYASIQPLLDEIKALRPEYEEAKEWLRANQERKDARKAAKEASKRIVPPPTPNEPSPVVTTVEVPKNLTDEQMMAPDRATTVTTEAVSTESELVVAKE